MIIEETLRVLLLADVAVAAITDRCWVGKMPQNAELPGLVITRVGAPRGLTLEGIPMTLVGMSFQVDSIGDTGEDVLRLSEAVRLGLSGFEGVVNGQCIQNAILQGDPFSWDDGPDLFRVTQTWVIWHDED